SKTLETSSENFFVPRLADHRVAKRLYIHCHIQDVLERGALQFPFRQRMYKKRSQAQQGPLYAIRVHDCLSIPSTYDHLPIEINYGALLHFFLTDTSPCFSYINLLDAIDWCCTFM